MSDIVFKVTKEDINSFFPICNNCKNHLQGLKCLAFEIIPNNIISGESIHTIPLKNQSNNIVFEPLND